MLRSDARYLPLPDCSVDAIVCDPPYGLGFMGKEWDSGKSFVERKADRRNRFDHVGGNHHPTSAADTARTRRVEAVRFGAWCQEWAAEALRVAKPGAHLLAFGGTRTFHRLAVAIEDAGWEIRDSIGVLGWLYGSGFPKSLDVSKAIDQAAGAERDTVATGPPVRRMIPGADQNRTGSWIKDNGREYIPTTTVPATDEAARWAGWGTALKPAWEPIIVARKPLAGTVAANMVAYGTGALNVDGCRVEAAGRPARDTVRDGRQRDAAYQLSSTSVASGVTDQGRWPSNLLLVHHPDCGDRCAPGCPVAELDAQSGQLTSGANPARRGSDKFRGVYQPYEGQRECQAARGADTGGASRFFPTFRYQAKAGKGERPVIVRGGHRIQHPTVKPVDLMRWLVRLVTPPGGLLLDMFCGSGATLQAAALEGFRAVGVDLEHDHCLLTRERLSWAVRVDAAGRFERGSQPSPPAGQAALFE